MNETIKIGQMSDLHLGNRQYGYFERLKDFYKAAITAADLLIEQSPDIIVVPGDIFHKSRPYPVAQRQSFKIFERFAGQGIPVYAIRGNHDASYVWSERWGGNEIHVLADLGLIHYLEDEYEEVELDDGRMIRVWGLGYHGGDAGTKLAALAKENKEALKNRTMPNVLLMHEFFDNMVPSAELSEYSVSVHGFDYVALGHYHRWWVNGAGNICCSGSTEHMSVADWKQQDRSVALVTLAKLKTKWKPSIERLRYSVRSKIRKTLELGSVSIENVTDAVTKALQEMELDNAVVRIDVRGTLSDTQQSMDVRSITQQFTKALHIDIISQMEYAGLLVKEDVSDDEVMREVFIQNLGVPKKQAGKWVKLATDLKSILTESFDSEGESTALKLLYDFVEVKTLEKKPRRKE